MEGKQIGADTDDQHMSEDTWSLVAECKLLIAETEGESESASRLMRLSAAEAVLQELACLQEQVCLACDGYGHSKQHCPTAKRVARFGGDGAIGAPALTMAWAALDSKFGHAKSAGDRQSSLPYKVSK